MIEADDLFRRYVEAVGGLTVICLAMFIVRVIATGTFRYWFIPENLALAWAALLFGWWLNKQLENYRWLNWRNISLTVIWLAVLPNSWYVLTDFIHVYPTGEISELFDISMMSLLIFNGFILGCTSLFLIHRQLQKRFNFLRTWLIVAALILLSSFAIYLGRDLRWSSWDVLTDPSGLLLNVSDRLISPLQHQRATNITGLFFVVVGSVYLLFYRLVSGLVPTKTDR